MQTVKNFKLNLKFSAWKNQIPESQQNLPYFFEDKTNQDKIAKKNILENFQLFFDFLKNTLCHQLESSFSFKNAQS